MKYHVYVDGSYNQEANIGVSGFAIYNENYVKLMEYACYIKPPTVFDKCGSGSCELTAVILAMVYCQYKKLHNVEICYDFTGCADLITKKMKPKEDSQRSYIKLFNKTCSKMSYKFKKIEAHSGEIYNAAIDKLVREKLRAIPDSEVFPRLVDRLVRMEGDQDDQLCCYIQP